MAHVEDRWHTKTGKRTTSYGKVRRWRVRYLGTNGKERNESFDKKIDADRFKTKTEAELNRGEWIDPILGKITLGEWAPKWFATKAGLKASARRDYESVLMSRVVPRWGDVALSAITYEDVTAWVASLVAEGLSDSRARKCHLVLKQVLQLAVKSGRLGRNVAEGVDGVPVPRRKQDRRYLTHDQVADLAEACAPYQLVVYVLAYCGLRFGELAGLRVRDIDVLRGRLSVVQNSVEVAGALVTDTPKGHRARWVPAPGFLRYELAESVRGRRADDRVFTAPMGGDLRENNFRKRCFDRAVIRLGLDPFTPHDLRHTTASLAVSAGANVKAVQRLLGHASAAMTLDVYADLFEDDLEGVAASLDKAASAARQRRAQRPGHGLGDLEPLRLRDRNAV